MFGSSAAPRFISTIRTLSNFDVCIKCMYFFAIVLFMDTFRLLYVFYFIIFALLCRCRCIAKDFLHKKLFPSSTRIVYHLSIHLSACIRFVITKLRTLDVALYHFVGASYVCEILNSIASIVVQYASSATWAVTVVVGNKGWWNSRKMRTHLQEDAIYLIHSLGISSSSTRKNGSGANDLCDTP